MASNKTGFNPIEFTITVESQEEADRLFCVFNHARITRFLDNYEACEEVRDILKSESNLAYHGKTWSQFCAMFR